MSRILIADDSWFQRVNVRNLLKEKNYDFLEASSGEEVIDLLGREQIDCIILDLVMPEVDGFAVLEKLQADNLIVPVIVVSADIQESTHEQCYSLGVKGIINKPLTPSSGLLPLVEQALNTVA